MPVQIIIENIKNIKKLDFTLPDKKGLYILTGNNGSGKTTLMTCLSRIDYSNAFKEFFKTTPKYESRTGKSKTIFFDDFSSTADGLQKTISYHDNGKSISYTYNKNPDKTKEARWTPSTKRFGLKELFDDSLKEVFFIKATDEGRFFIQEKDFQDIGRLKIQDADKHLIDELNTIFNTTKFNKLKYIQTNRGHGNRRGNRAYLIQLDANHYFTEKNFSLGEVLVLNTLITIENLNQSEKTLLLIDEVEMALHPTAQINLLKYLEKQAKDKNLIVLLSTHSSSIIKYTKNIIYLENNKGDVEVVNNCYPAYVLKNMAIEEDFQPDCLFVVEDDKAKLLLNEIIRYYNENFSKKNIKPIYKILPIGGYIQVINFFENSQHYVFNKKIKFHIFLDKDVETNKNSKAVCDERKKANSELKDCMHFLPITPELGLWEYLLSNAQKVQDNMDSQYQDNNFNFKERIKDIEQQKQKTANERQDAKDKFTSLLDEIHKNFQINKDNLTEFLFRLFVKDYFLNKEETKDFRSKLEKIFNTNN